MVPGVESMGGPERAEQVLPQASSAGHDWLAQGCAKSASWPGMQEQKDVEESQVERVPLPSFLRHWHTAVLIVLSYVTRLSGVPCSQEFCASVRSRYYCAQAHRPTLGRVS